MTAIFASFDCLRDARTRDLDHSHPPFAGAYLDFTHVYVFDRVFSPVTLQALARRLMASPFRVLISYRTAAEWWESGLTIVQPVAKIRVQTTGKETMNAYIYINMRHTPDGDAVAPAPTAT